MDSHAANESKSFIGTFVSLNVLGLPGVCTGAVLGYIAWDMIGIVPGLISGSAPAIVLVLVLSYLHVPLYIRGPHILWLTGPLSGLTFVFTYVAAVTAPPLLSSVVAVEQAQRTVFYGLVITLVAWVLSRRSDAHQSR